MNRHATLSGILLLGWAATAFSSEPATLPGMPASQPAILAPGNTVRRLELDGRTRSYLIHVPPKFDPRRPTPVVLIYHGALMNGQEMVWFCGMNRKSDQAGFVAIYPNGTGAGDVLLTFNAWTMPSPGPQGRPDDVAFTAKLLDDLGTVMMVDAKRVFATGMSNGGFMCYRLAAELSERIAAIAPVAGTLGIPECHPDRPVPVLHFHGTADTIVPFAGPNPKLPRLLRVTSVEETIKTWIKLDGCREEPKITELPNVVEDGTSVRRKVYGPGKDGTEVALYVIEGGGHTWPGEVSPLKFLGKSTMNISANDVIWEFFSRHPMK